MLPCCAAQSRGSEECSTKEQAACLAWLVRARGSSTAGKVLQYEARRPECCNGCWAAEDDDDSDEPMATARELVNNNDWPSGEAKGSSPTKGAHAGSGGVAKAAGKRLSTAGSSKSKAEAKLAAEASLGPLEEAMRLSQLQRLQQQQEGTLLHSSVSTAGGSSAVLRSSPFDGRLPSGRGSGSNTARSGLSSVEAEVDEAYTMPLQFSLLHSNLSGDQQQLQAAAAAAAGAAGAASPWGSFGWSSDGPGGLDHRDVPLSMQASSPNRVAARSSRLGRHTSAPPAVPATSMGGPPVELQPGRSISLRAMAGSSAQASTLGFQPSGSMQAAGSDVAAGGWGFAALPAAGSSPTRSGVFASQQRQQYVRSLSVGARVADPVLTVAPRSVAQHGLNPRQVSSLSWHYAFQASTQLYSCRGRARAWRWCALCSLAATEFLTVGTGG